MLLTLGFGAGRLSNAKISAAGGTLDSPGPPESTYSYTLEDIYNRLSAGTEGAQSTFTEPTSGPTVGTMHTLNDIMSVAPQKDNTDGATQTHVLTGRNVWGLTSGQWGPITGIMPDNGAVALIPTTTDVAIAAGYHNGAGFVEGDADLLADNIKNGVDIFGVTGTYITGTYVITAFLPKTGQTESYATGDDGDLEKGVAWPSPRFTDNANGTVTDNLTKLIWLKDANCAGTTISWTLAISYSNALYDGCTDCFGTSGDCGLSDGSNPGDWRLPNVRELQSLVHYGFRNPALPNTAGTGQWTEGDPFTGVQSDWYWSSSTDVNYASNAWFVYMSTGWVQLNNKTFANYVWPVRGGQ